MTDNDDDGLMESGMYDYKAKDYDRLAESVATREREAYERGFAAGAMASAAKLDAESARLRTCGTENDIVVGHERAALLVRHFVECVPPKEDEHV